MPSVHSRIYGSPQEMWNVQSGLRLAVFPVYHLLRAEFVHWLPMGETCPLNMICVDYKISFKNWSVHLKSRYCPWKPRFGEGGKEILLKNWKIWCIPSWKKSLEPEEWLPFWYKGEQRRPPLSLLLDYLHMCSCPLTSRMCVTCLDFDKMANPRLFTGDNFSP